MSPATLPDADVSAGLTLLRLSLLSPIMLLVSPLIQVFQYALQPIAPFTWFGLGISSLDVVAALRLCIVLRQIRESLYAQHVSTKGQGSVENKSFVKDLSTTLTVIYGGEAMTGV